jgi:predicted dehydrogenase
LPLWFVQRDLAMAAENAPQPTSANDRPGIALVGCGSQGMGDASGAARLGDIVAVCDVDDGHVESAVRRFSRNGKTPKKFSDFRKVMEEKDVQVIVGGTPDHWHTLVNMAAAKAHKDIYSEKPLTLTIDEGKQLVKAVRDNKIVLQTGTQQRSDRRFRLAAELVRNERIGKLKTITVWLPAGLRAGPFKSSAVPAWLNWDFWQGQAPAVDYVKERCHTNFRFWLDYSGGSMTDWGAHHVDIARWAMGLEGPTEVEGKVLAEPIPGGYTAISEYEIIFNWANGVKQIVRTTKDDNIFGGAVNRDGQRNGIRFEGTDGWIWVNRGDIQASNEDILQAQLPDNAVRLEVSGDHMRYFMECVRSRKDPIAKVEVGHRSACICHLAAIALRLGGRKLKWDPEKELFTGDGAQEANTYVARAMRKPYDYTFVG